MLPPFSNATENTQPYHMLTDLPLPGPAVVLDMRQPDRDNHILINNIAYELEHLEADLQLHEIARWRHLITCIDLLTLTTQASAGATMFTLTNRNGHTTELANLQELTYALGRNHLDRVRNNRIAASHDTVAWKREIHHYRFSTTDSEQVTVRMFVVVDGEDKRSMQQALALAHSLKEWYQGYGNENMSGRDRPLHIALLLMHVDTNDHDIADLITLTGHPSPFDALIPLHNYREDEANIQQTQNSLVAFILYTFLLLAPEQTPATTENQPSFVAEDTIRLAPCPIFSIGISSLEHATRLGNQWLAHSLIAQCIEQLEDTRTIRQETLTGKLQQEVKQQFTQWEHDVEAFTENTFSELLPTVEKIRHIQYSLLQYKSTANRWLRPSLQSFTTICEQVDQLYTEQEALFRLVLQEGTATLQSLCSDAEYPPEDKLLWFARQQFQQLGIAIAHVPANLLHATNGMLPRLQRQLQIIYDQACHLHYQADQKPDIDLFRYEFNTIREVQQRQLSNRVSFSNLWRKQQYANALQQLHSLINTHIRQVLNALAAQIKLHLLQQTGLYTPTGSISPFQQHIKTFAQSLHTAYIQASKHKAMVHEHLLLNQSIPATSQDQQAPLNLTQRKELLTWEQIADVDKRLYTQISTSSALLPTLRNLLLLYAGSEISMISDEQRSYPQTESIFPPSPAEKQFQHSAQQQNILTAQQLFMATTNHQQTIEQILANWMHAYILHTSPELLEMEQQDIITYLDHAHINFASALNNLRERNRVMGYRDLMLGTDRFYLLLPPGNQSKQTIKTYQSTLLEQHITALYFPDIEKLIYLHIHQQSYVINKQPVTRLQQQQPDSQHHPPQLHNSPHSP